MGQDLAVQRGQQVDVGNTEVGAGDLFMDDAGREAAQSQTAEFLGQLGRDEAHLAHRFHQRAIEHARPVALLEAGSDAIGGETPNLIAERDQVFVEIRVHLLASL